MAHDPDVRRRVRALFVQGMALTSAATEAGVSYQTARNWRRADAAVGDDWDIARQARLLSRSGIEEMTNQVLGELAAQFVVTIEALKEDTGLPAAERAKILVQLMDGYNKAIGAASRAMPAANRLATAMDVIRFLTSHIAQHAPELRAQFVAVIEEAGDSLVAAFGGSAA